MSMVSLMISSGNGPGECRQAVAHVLERIEAEAEARGISIDVSRAEASHGPVSAVLVLGGVQAEALAKSWEGVVLWRCPSQLRPRHRRKNWFVQVFRLPEAPIAVAISPEDVEMQAIRAGGPGGQHQNKTSSAIRARWKAGSGEAYHVVVRDHRSQHQNRREAISRLEALVSLDLAERRDGARSSERMLHHQVERGAPRRVFDGVRFKEAKV